MVQSGLPIIQIDHLVVTARQRKPPRSSSRISARHARTTNGELVTVSPQTSEVFTDCLARLADHLDRSSGRDC
jgi:hypothetical protein